LAVIIIKFVIH